MDNFNHMTNRFLTLVILFSFPALVLAVTEEKEAPPTYNIEVIVFETLAQASWTEEYWPELNELPSLDNATTFLETDKEPLMLTLSEKTMANKVWALNKKGYRVLFHQAWTQLGLPDKNAQQILIDSDTKYGSSLLGTVRFYKTRFAHVDFDLVIEKLIPHKVASYFSQRQKMPPETLPNHWRFNLKESRKLNSGDLHYLDHPMFGVLVQIDAVEENQEIQDATAPQ